MNITNFPVAYYDEFGIWGMFSQFITSRLPINGVSLNSPEGDILLPPLTVAFLPHTEAFWHSQSEDSFLKPYLWIFVLKFTNYELFKRDMKLKLKELIGQMQDKNIEWLVLFVPSLNRLVKSDHKNFANAYGKISSDLSGMLGKCNMARFYSPSSKCFVDIGQPSVIKDDFWQEFLKSVGKGVSLGIQKTISFHIKESCLYEESDYLKYCLHLHALASIYELLGLKPQSLLYYDYIRNKTVEARKLMGYQYQELSMEFTMDSEAFRNLLKSGEITQLSLLRFIYKKQLLLLESCKNHEKSSELAFLWVQNCKNIFKSSQGISENTFMYHIGSFSAELINGHISGIR